MVSQTNIEPTVAQCLVFAGMAQDGKNSVPMLMGKYFILDKLHSSSVNNYCKDFLCHLVIFSLTIY